MSKKRLFDNIGLRRRSEFGTFVKRLKTIPVNFSHVSMIFPYSYSDYVNYVFALKVLDLMNVCSALLSRRFFIFTDFRQLFLSEFSDD